MKILIDVADGIATLTLNRPEAMNALSLELRRDIDAALQQVEADEAVRVIILTGAGQRAFCAGLDLKELASDPAAMAAATSIDRRDNIAVALRHCRKPVIGAINGVAITGGFELALACDILIASETARFADTHVRIGILPGWGLSQKLSRLIGVYRAREFSLSGNFIDADTAERWGLVNRVVAPAALLPAARRLAADIASADPGMVTLYKALIDDGFDRALADGLALESARSDARNAAVTTDAVAARYGDVMARGRTQ